MALSYSQTRPINILLAEDNPADAMLTLEGFKSAEAVHNIVVFGDGQQVIDHLNQECRRSNASLSDMIILDLNMPKKSGHEVLAELKSNELLSIIPVIIFTASDAQRDIVESYRLHASAYLTKPIDFAEFIRLVKSIDEFWFNFVKFPEVGPHGN